MAAEEFELYLAAGSQIFAYILVGLRKDIPDHHSVRLLKVSEGLGLWAKD